MAEEGVEWRRRDAAASTAAGGAAAAADSVERSAAATGVAPSGEAAGSGADAECEGAGAAGEEGAEEREDTSAAAIRQRMREALEEENGSLDLEGGCTPRLR